jgi:hypothetical protein
MNALPEEWETLSFHFSATSVIHCSTISDEGSEWAIKLKIFSKRSVMQESVALFMHIIIFITELLTAATCQ